MVCNCVGAGSCATLDRCLRNRCRGLLAHLAPVLGHHGYLAVGGFITLEDFGIPVPGETILIAAAVYAGAGTAIYDTVSRYSRYLLIALAVVAAVIIRAAARRSARPGDKTLSGATERPL